MSRWSRIAWVVPLSLSGLLVAIGGFAQVDATVASPDAALQEASALRAKGDVRGAIEKLKGAIKAYPDHARLRHALSLGYVADNNDFWALKVLNQYEQEHPPACQTRAFIAGIHLKQANLELAEEVLSRGGCGAPPEIRARFLLLQARVASQQGDEARAAELVAEARSGSRFYEEDLAALDALRNREDPGHIPFASWRVDLAVGFTGNGLAGSPQDPADVGVQTSSSLGSVDARVRLVIPATKGFRPVLETQLRALGLLASEVGFLSYRQPSLRPGVLIGDTYPRLLLTYGVDAIQISGGDRYETGPLWYSEGHRFDYELEASDGLFAFGGVGRRWYREAGRKRWEMEQGLAGGFALTRDLRMMAGGSARWFRAANEAYDAFGSTVLAQLLYRLPANLEARLNGSVSVDDYPLSHGYFAGAKGDKRTDVLLRAKPGLWLPSHHGFRLGFDYEYSGRISTAGNYSYTDHRMLLHGTWTMDGDRLGVRALPPEGREPMEHGVSLPGQQSDEDLRIQDLMRQDEAVKRGSSCLN